jgi:hypothetical protein
MRARPHAYVLLIVATPPEDHCELLAAGDPNGRSRGLFNQQSSNVNTATDHYYLDGGGILLLHSSGAPPVLALWLVQVAFEKQLALLQLQWRNAANSSAQTTCQ